MRREDFSRSQTLDCRHAMAAALVRRIEALQFDAGGNLFAFARVFDNWPAWTEKFAGYAACVLPDDEEVYADAMLTPTFLEDTWEPQDQQGRPLGVAGWGLEQFSEAESNLSLLVRAPSEGERTAMIKGVETAFQVERGVGNYEEGRRYGILLPMPEYFGMPARFALASHRLLDDAETAARNQWEAVFVVRAQAPVVRVIPMQPMRVRITQLVDGEPTR